MIANLRCMKDHISQTTTPAQDIQAMAARYRTANGVGIEVLNLIGTQADALIETLPQPIRDRLEDVTELALGQAMQLAHGSRRAIGGQSDWMNRVVTTVLGAVGGVGGAATALTELPLTTTILLRAIQDVAVAQGFDPTSENVRFDCIQVFAAAGPLARDDGTDLAFLGTRMALTSGGVQKMAAWVAPRLASALGQKLAAQAIPVIGAAAGAATNYAYTRYYQDMAFIHFGLRRLAIDSNIPHDALVRDFRIAVQADTLT